MKPFRLAIALATTMLLAACYASNGLLLDADQAAHPLIDGVYVRTTDPADRYRVSLGSDGWYRVEQFNANGTIGATQRALFNAIEPQGGRAAYAIAVETDDGFAYAVALTDGQRVYLATPDCGDPLDRDLAVDHGGEWSDNDPMTPNCTFKNRQALLTALGAFAGQADFGGPYQRH